MAKIKTRDIFDWQTRPDGSRFIPAVNHRAKMKRKPHQGVKVHSEVTLSRLGSGGAEAFSACVTIGSANPRKKRGSYYNTVCMKARNPRLALKSALAKASRTIGTRSGAFGRKRK